VCFFLGCICGCVSPCTQPYVCACGCGSCVGVREYDRAVVRAWFCVCVCVWVGVCVGGGVCVCVCTGSDTGLGFEVRMQACAYQQGIPVFLPCTRDDSAYRWRLSKAPFWPEGGPMTGVLAEHRMQNVLAAAGRDGGMADVRLYPSEKQWCSSTGMSACKCRLKRMYTCSKGEFEKRRGRGCTDDGRLVRVC
jgi:hypothetical protein